MDFPTNSRADANNSMGIGTDVDVLVILSFSRWFGKNKLSDFAEKVRTELDVNIKFIKAPRER